MATKPHKRSPVPPPGHVMNKLSYDRTAAKKELEAELDEIQQIRKQPMRIRIVAGKVQMEAELNGSATAAALVDALPVTASAETWGREVYFKVPMHVPHEDAQAKVPPGTVAFWPDGDCLCIFFGQTPYSPVNVVGKLLGEPNAFEKVGDGDPVQIEKVE